MGSVMRGAGAAALVLGALAAGCAGSAGTFDGSAAPDGAAPDVAASADVRVDVAPDSAPSSTRACQDVRECAGLAPPSGSFFGNGWSCVVGTCTWAPVSGRTCYEFASGCHQCRIGGAEVCPGAPCLTAIQPDAVRIESANCQRAFLQDVARCEGEFVRLNDGTYCLLSDAGTNAIRYVLSCGACETVFTPR